MSEIHTIDAKGKPLGRIATEAAHVLRGKANTSFQRHTKPADKVVIKNAKHLVLTGRKIMQGSNERYSGYPSGLKRVKYETTFEKDPRELVRNAVSGMLPRTRLKKDILKNLTIYVDEK
jgi:large subunit ribosomal protein L13